jgi:hypothetical protein
MPQSSRTYDVHGFRIDVRVFDAQLAIVLDEVFSRQQLVDADQCDATIKLQYGLAACQPFNSTAWDHVYHGTLPDGLAIICAASAERRRISLPDLVSLEFDPASAQARIVVAPGAEWCVARGAIIPALMEFLARDAQHAIHAACLALESDSDRCILLAGGSGAGKTTTTLALAGGGMPLHGDDISFLRWAGGSLRVWGLLLECKVQQRTLGMLQWLEQYPRRRAHRSDEQLVDVRAALGGDPQREFMPAALIILDGRSADRHHLEPMPRPEALTRLVRETVRTPHAADRPIAKRAMDVIGELVRTCPVYRLAPSPHIEQLPALMRQTLAAHEPSA